MFPRIFRQRATRRRSRVALCVAAGCLVAAGCGEDPVSSRDDLSPAAREAARARTAQARVAATALETAGLAEALVGGVRQGIAGDAGGLATELGDAFRRGQTGAGAATLGTRLAAARDAATATAGRLRQAVVDAEKGATPADDPQPGDPLFHWSRTNPDGSVSEISVYQDAPLPVVRIEISTTWPEGHRFLARIGETVILDRGTDFLDPADDVWLSYAGEVQFADGQALRREIDERATGGLQDGDRVRVVSTFLPRREHPRLADIVSVLVVDVHLLSDASDDRFVRADRTTRFTGTAHDGGAPRVVEAAVPETPVAEGDTPCGGHAAREIFFDRRNALVDVQATADWSCAGGGSLSRAEHWADGSTTSFVITETSSGVYVLEALERDGTRTTGECDTAAHTFSILTEYGSQRDPERRAISGRTREDGKAWELEEEVTYRDGFVERNTLRGEELEDGRRLAGTHDGRDGRLEFSLQSSADDTILEGEVENDRGQRLTFRVETLSDGGRLVDFLARDPVRTIEGHLVFDASGCAEGTLIVTEGGQTWEIPVAFCDDEPVRLGAGSE